MQITMSQANSKNQFKPTFGWNYNTHRRITKKAIQEVFGNSIEEIRAKYPKLNTEILAAIEEGSTKPDLLKKELGFYTNRHFYFVPQKLGQKLSFGPRTNKNNALRAMLDHYQQLTITAKSINGAKLSDKTPIADELGMMLHFVQDVTVPMHTQRGGFLRKAIDFWMHKNYEYGERFGALAKQEILAANYKPNALTIQKSESRLANLSNIFFNNIEHSTNPNLKIKRTNKIDWEQIQQVTFNQAVDSTKAVLEIFKDFFI